MTPSKIIELLSFPRETREYLLKRLKMKDIPFLAKNAYICTGLDFPICKYSAADRLSVLVWLLSEKNRDYLALCVPNDVIVNTFSDVSLLARIYRKEHQAIGLSEADAIWFRHIINTEIFQIGALQFQPFQMVYLDEEMLGEPYMIFSGKQKEQLPSGCSVINCHIPYGAQLKSEMIRESFSMAMEYFRNWFPSKEFRAFLCYSWLLYPPMMDLLKEDSNIRRFASHFDIIGKCPDNEQAKEYLRLGTTLSRSFHTQPHKFGYACGCITIADQDIPNKERENL